MGRLGEGRLPRAYAFQNIQSREHRGMGRREEEEEEMTRMSGMQGLLTAGGRGSRQGASQPPIFQPTLSLGGKEMDSVNAERKRGQVGMEPNPKCHTQRATVKVAYSVPGTIPGAVPGTIPTAGHSSRPRSHMGKLPQRGRKLFTITRSPRLSAFVTSWVTGAPSLWEALNARPRC